MNHWNPVLYENRNLVPTSTDPKYFLTDDLADHAVAWVRRVKSIAPERPFLLYVAPGATHAPHQAPADWIAKFKGQFDMDGTPTAKQPWHVRSGLASCPLTPN